MVKKKLNKIKLTRYVKALGLSAVQDIYILNGIVRSYEQATQNNDFYVIDSKDCIVSPGFIDPQVNGFEDCNFWDLNENCFEKIDKLRIKLAASGVVAFCPTIITAPRENLIRSINLINSYIKQSDPALGAKILGIHIEGVFITKYGVHNVNHVQKELTVENVKPFVRENVILFTLAPELDKNGEAIGFLQKNNILVSIGHSNGTYEDGEVAIKRHNLKTVTHMFNSLKGIEGFYHRGENLNLETLKQKLEDDKCISPKTDGIMLALLNNKDVLCMVIADGVHVNKEVIKLLKGVKSANSFALASDLIASCVYNEAKSKGILGGSLSLLNNSISNLINWNVSTVEEGLICASKPIASQLNVAKNIGLGEIAFNNEANLVLWDTKINAVKGTIIGENVFLNY